MDDLNDNCFRFCLENEGSENVLRGTYFINLLFKRILLYSNPMIYV